MQCFGHRVLLFITWHTCWTSRSEGRQMKEHKVDLRRGGMAKCGHQTYLGQESTSNRHLRTVRNWIPYQTLRASISSSVKWVSEGLSWGLRIMPVKCMAHCLACPETVKDASPYCDQLSLEIQPTTLWFNFQPRRCQRISRGLENPMDGEAWWAEVHGVAKSRTRLGDFTLTFHFHALEKEMATHSSVLGWRIPGTGEPGGLPSMGSHRVGHDWSDLAPAAAAALTIPWFGWSH